MPTHPEPASGLRSALAAAIAVSAMVLTGCAGQDATDRTGGDQPRAVTRDSNIVGGAPPHGTNGPVTLPKATSVPPSGTTFAPGAKPTILTFQAPPELSCGGLTEATATVVYETRNADRVAILLDGRQLPGAPSVSGRLEVTVPCDGRAHVVLLTAVSPDNQTAVDSRAILAT